MRCFSIRFSAMERASLSSTANITSPACGTSDKPKISTGMDGRATFTFSPRSFVIARTLPYATPARIVSPTRKEPFCTNTVHTGPRPLSNCASITIPCALRLGFAFNSCTSATSKIVSNRSSIP